MVNVRAAVVPPVTWNVWLALVPSLIAAPIVGATKLHHLDDALASVSVHLSADEIAALEEPYVPHEVVGFV